MVQTCKWADGLKPIFFMLVVQFAYAGANIAYKLAVNAGMNCRIIVAYRFIFSAAFVAPLALIFERNRPKLTWTILFLSFLCGLFGGALFQNLYAQSLALTSITFISAMINLLPAVTFILSIFFGLEKIVISARVGQAKVIGTLIGIGGAMVLNFYKGVEINLWSTHVNLLKHHQGHGSQHSGHSQALGFVLAVLSCFSSALWLIFQAKMSAIFPCPYSSAALMSIMASIQCVVFAICVDQDWTQWKLGWNVRLFSVLFLGIVASGVVLILVSWCVRGRGPFFVAVFNPLMLVISVLAGSLLLDEKIHLGSIIGAVFIIIGLYTVLWGKAKEIKKMPPPAASERSESSKAGETTDSIAISLPQVTSSTTNATGTA